MAKAEDGFPPRGSGQRGRAEALPVAVWGHPWQLNPANWHWRPGMILLGQWDGQRLGLADNRHVVTVAGSRAGKSTSVLTPNLREWPGSALVLDPKGELVRTTADARRRMGQEVYILDPFGTTGQRSNAHNPFAELDVLRSAHVVADAAQLAEALIIGNDKDPHWTDAARNLIRGLTLHLMSGNQSASIRALRRLLNADEAELKARFEQMADNPAFDEALSNIGSAFLGKLNSGGKEMQSILSTAQEQTTALDDVRHITDGSDFQLRALKERKVTIYLVLPGMRMGTHFRWLRLVIQQALAAMEVTPNDKLEHPVLFMLEEFAALGYMRPIETAAGFMAGFGVKLWSVLQDFTQLKTHYPNSWETFLGNAGVIQAFGNVDLTTTEYLSKRMGHTIVVETQDVQVSGSTMAHGDLGRREHVRHTSLLEAAEITQFFSRESNRQLVLVPGRPPIYMNRLDWRAA
jgi:type IV secretion system protein VirD4